MNKIKRQIAFLLLLLQVSSFTYAKANLEKLPTEGQVAKLAMAASKGKPHSIDVTLYLELTTPPKPIEQIRKEVEEMIDRMDQEFYKKMGWTKDSLPDYAAKRRKRAIEINFNLQVKRQQFVRLIKKRIRKTGHNQRVDQVIAEPGEELDPNMPFESTYVNVGNRDSVDFYSFDYKHKIQSAHIEDESGWVKRDPARFACMPLGVASVLQTILGANQGTITDPIFVSDFKKMQELTKTGIVKIDIAGGVRRFRIMVTPEQNGSGNRDRIEIGDPNYLPTTVMVCDRGDYSRVYNVKFFSRRTGKPFYVRECSNYDNQGFPRNVTEIQYDKEGGLKEKSVYNIVKVDLEPSLPEDLFSFQPPSGYKVKDQRSKKP